MVQKQKNVVKVLCSKNNRNRNLSPAMENSLRLPEPHLNRSLRASSCITLEIEDPGSLGRQRSITLGRNRSMSDAGLHNNTTNDERSNDNEDKEEILYKTTDIVLIICAAVFIISSITSVFLWLYGCPWVDLVNNEFHFKP